MRTRATGKRRRSRFQGRHFKKRLSSRFITRTAPTPVVAAPVQTTTLDKGGCVVYVPYRQVVKVLALRWMPNCTRTDIADAVREVSRHSHAFPCDDSPLLVRILEFLSSTRDQGIAYEVSSGTGLVAYADANYASSEEIGNIRSMMVFRCLDVQSSSVF